MMFRNALRQSGRAVGAVSGTGRVAVVSSKAPLPLAVDGLVVFVKLVCLATVSALSSIAAFSCVWGYIGSKRLIAASPQSRSTTPAAVNTATRQARNYAADAKASPTEVSSILEQRIRGVQEEAGLAETGRVLSVGYV